MTMTPKQLVCVQIAEFVKREIPGFARAEGGLPPDFLLYEWDAELPTRLFWLVNTGSAAWRGFTYEVCWQPAAAEGLTTDYAPAGCEAPEGIYRLGTLMRLPRGKHDFWWRWDFTDDPEEQLEAARALLPFAQSAVTEYVVPFLRDMAEFCRTGMKSAALLAVEAHRRALES